MCSVVIYVLSVHVHVCERVPLHCTVCTCTILDRLVRLSIAATFTFVYKAGLWCIGKGRRSEKHQVRKCREVEETAAVRLDSITGAEEAVLRLLGVLYMEPWCHEWTRGVCVCTQY